MVAWEVQKRKSILEDLRLSLPSQLPGFLAGQRWFGGKARAIHSADLVDIIPVESGRVEAFILLARMQYTSGLSETYVLPVLAADSAVLEGKAPFLKTLDRAGNKNLILTDALGDESVLRSFVDAIEAEAVWPGVRGQIQAHSTNLFRPRLAGALPPSLMKCEQSNSSINYGDCFILKLFRRLEEGINPDLEIGLFLTERAHFQNVPQVAGSLLYRSADGETTTLGILQEFIPNQNDAWRFSVQALCDFLSHVSEPFVRSPIRGEGLPSDQEIPAIALARLASYTEAIELLGKRTAELHLALAWDPADPAFAAEPYTAAFQERFQESARELTERNFGLLRARLGEVPSALHDRAEEILNLQGEILQRFRPPDGAGNRGMRIRIHGDYHLGQVLCTGSDFVIIDFEGEPARSLPERRTKRSPLQDVASMLRSFHYAAYSQLVAPTDNARRPGGLRDLIPWSEYWYSRVSSHFLSSYLENASCGSFLPPSSEETAALLQIHLIEKAVYELGYELNNRPAWMAIPLAGILRILKQSTGT